MLKNCKAQMIIILAVCFLVSMSVVIANYDIANLNLESNSVNEVEKWRLPIGSNNVRYETKYTIILNEDKYEYYLKYKEIATEKFKGYYWGINEKEFDEKYIYTNEIEFTREDVIEFLEIKDRKLAALIKEGYKFSLFMEPCYNYKKGKWSNIYKNTLRELYMMLPEYKENKVAYENAIDEKGNVIKNKIQGIEFLREIIIKKMNSLEANNLEVYEKYNDEINSKMYNKGFIGYQFEDERIKMGEFLKMITLTLWPEFEYEEVEIGVHWAKPYANALDRKVLMTIDYDYSKLEKLVTRKDAARLLCLFYINYNKDYELNDTFEYIQNFSDESLIIEKIERILVDDVVRFGLMDGFEDGTFKPNNFLSKKETEKIFKDAISNN